MKKRLIVVFLIAAAAFSCAKKSTTTPAAAPTACFKQSSIYVGLQNTDTFNATCSSNAVSYSWTPDDGSGTTTNTTPIFYYSFQTPGTHYMKLSVTNSNNQTSVDSQVVNVDTAYSYPYAEITFTPSTNHYTIGVADTVTDTTSTAASTCHWDFGDGFTSNLPIVAHAYATAGPGANSGWTLTLTVYHHIKQLGITYHNTIQKQVSIQP